MKNIFKVITSAVFMVVLSTACTEKHPDRIQQGVDIDVDQVQELNQSRYWLKTESSLGRSNITSAANQLHVNNNAFNLNNFPIVKWSSNSSLLEQQPNLTVRGKQNFKYEIRYKLTQKTIVILKVGSEKDIPFDERTYADKLENGLYGVPILVYPVISYYTRQKVRNSDNEETNIYSYYPTQEYERATHVKLNKNNPTIYRAKNKKDVFPKSIFEGEWYYNETAVSTRLGSGLLVGYQGHSAFSPASRIRFSLTEDYLHALNLNIDDERVNPNDRLNQKPVLSIPIKWFEYRKNRSDQPQEEFNDEIPWDERNYIELGFKNVETSNKTFRSMLRFILQSLKMISIDKYTTVLDVRIDDDYFSFTNENIKTGTVIRYSFRKISEENNYVPRKVHREDRRQFGIFYSLKNRIRDYRTVLLEDEDDHTLMNRFNPKKDIVYHFTTTTPHWVRDVGREAINLWQQAFDRVGLKTRIRIDESKDVEAGDIRYNALNFVEYNLSRSIGYGPSLSDNTTGEIISATTNMYIESVKIHLIWKIRNYLYYKMGFIYDFRKTGQNTEINSRANKVLSLLENNYTEWDAEENKIVPLKTFRWAGNQRTIEFAPLIEEEELGQVYEAWSQVDPNGGPTNFHDFHKRVLLSGDLSLLSGQGDEPHYLASSPDRNLFKTIEANCVDLVSYASQFQGASRDLPGTQEELSFISKCAKKLIPLGLLGITVHELGHNMGYAHNFAGSGDKINYADPWSYEYKYIDLKPFEDVIQSGSSTAMEYIPMAFSMGLVPGPYDLAALRFSYKNEIEVEGEDRGYSVVKLDPDLDIAKNLTIIGKKRKPYAYCDDIEAVYRVDPMCAKHDYGSTAVESVKLTIDRYFSALNVYHYRHERIGLAEGNRIVNTAIRLKQFYDQWRVYVSHFVGSEQQYLEDISEEEYEAIIERMLNDEEHGELYRDYYDARNLIFNFFITVAFMPDKYCMVNHDKLGETIYELSRIKDDLSNSGDKGKVMGCADEKATAYLSERGMTLISEVGHYLYNGRFDLDASDIGLNIYYSHILFDYAGMMPDRATAFYTLTTRASFRYDNVYRTRFAPNMMDEPDIRSLINIRLMSRVSDGTYIDKNIFDKDELIKSASLYPQEQAEQFVNSKKYMRFQRELPLIKFFVDNYFTGLYIPGSLSASDRRRSVFKTYYATVPPHLLGRIANMIDYHNRIYLYTLEKGSATDLMMWKVNTVRLQLKLGKEDPVMLSNLLNDMIIKVASLFPETEDPEWTVQKTYNLVEKLEKELGALDDKGQPVYSELAKQLWNMMFVAEYGVYNQVKALMDEIRRVKAESILDEETLAELDQKLEDMMAQKLNDQYENQPGGPVKIPTASSVLLERFERNVKPRIFNYNLLGKHREAELKAHIELMLETLAMATK